MWKGVCLALANVVVISFLIAARERDAESMIIVGFYGTIPAVIVGAFCGALASAFPRGHVALRHAMVMLPAALLVVALAASFGMQRYTFMANMPTLACCLLLERWTRAAKEDEVEQMPTARVA